MSRALKLVYSADTVVKYPTWDFRGNDGGVEEVVTRKEVCGTIAKGIRFDNFATYSPVWWTFRGHRPKVIAHIYPPHLEVGTGQLVPDGPPEDGDWAEERVDWPLPPGWRGRLVLE